MISKKLTILAGLVRRIWMTQTDRQILGKLLEKGRSFPGDILKDLKISQNPGLKSIRELTNKGYIIRENQSSFIRINPDMRKAVKIMTG
jgi:predicted transcriptional regulator